MPLVLKQGDVIWYAGDLYLIVKSAPLSDPEQLGYVYLGKPKKEHVNRGAAYINHSQDLNILANGKFAFNLLTLIDKHD